MVALVPSAPQRVGAWLCNRQQPGGRTRNVSGDESSDAGRRAFTLRRAGKNPLAERPLLRRGIHSNARRGSGAPRTLD